MPGIIGSVIQAAGSAVGKVFVIAALGYCSVLYPKENPLIPKILIGKISRISFNLFTLALIYSTMAKNISLDTISYLWFLVVSGLVVIPTSFLTATLLERLPMLRVKNRTDFEALRIAASFPNIVALPILIFPALCEYKIVHEAFITGDKLQMTEDEMYDDCVEQSNQMIFVYFFAWNLMFWVVGNQVLVSAGELRRDSSVYGINDAGTLEEQHCITDQVIGGLKSVFLSTGFIAMLLGFITASIPPLQEALFEPASWCRFLGSAVESLAAASPSLGTIIVAASLVGASPKEPKSESNVGRKREVTDVNIEVEPNTNVRGESSDVSSCDVTNVGERGIESRERENGLRGSNPISSQMECGKRENGLTDNNHLSSRMYLRSSFKLVRSVVIKTIRSPSMSTHLWFIASKLVISPAIICGLLITLDCSGMLVDINPLAKLVVLLNASLPGALIVVIVLQTRELTETASIVAEVYLPSYIISIFTIAFWASIGLYISIPDDDGNSFCYSK